ncbi:MAG: N-carbamoyl-D-amino-acid hydrolase, partial [Gaiellaceae bacterium]|nr:N-carbamoyl-D-amino-acid hydrolase [Gaiellaceae bacterium]
MSRVIRVGAAQMGPIQRAESRQAVVRRMLDLLDQAKSAKCDLVVYPELTLTTFFPRWYMTDRAEVDAWFESDIPNAATRPLFDKVAEYGIAFSFGYAELTPDGHHFNTAM